MAQKQNFGKLADDSFIFKEITWEIPNVLSLPKQIDYEVRSPEFSFANGTWVLSMYPYGERCTDSIEHIDLNIRRLQSLEVEQTVYWKLFLKTSKGKEFEPFRFCDIFTSSNNYDGVRRYMKRSKLLTMQNSLAPEGALTVVCQLRTKNAAICDVIPQEKVVRPVRNAGKLVDTSKDNQENSIEAYTQTERGFEFENDQFKAAAPGKKFALDYKKLLLNEDGCDVTLQVKGQKFQAHRAILRARSPVFACMLKHNMKETNMGLVDIVDCEPETFPDFLCFLYCGSAESITSQNACSLYRAADKYDVQDLKNECLTFIRSHLDVDNFCNIIALALQHNETDLIQQAIDFFAENMKKIILTVKWQVFLAENPVQGNELFVKAVGADKG